MMNDENGQLQAENEHRRGAAGLSSFVFRNSSPVWLSALLLSAGGLVKHFSRFYVVLGAPFRRQLEPLWQRLLVRALAYVPPAEPVVAVFDETVSKKSGRSIEGLG
jgi:hypothetical protein